MGAQNAIHVTIKQTIQLQVNYYLMEDSHVVPYILQMEM
jgi:hypothetical protein